MEDIKRDLEMPENYKYATAFITMRCNFDCSFCNNHLGPWVGRDGYTEKDGDSWVAGLNRIK